MKKLKDKILYCLENYPRTREDDITLTLTLWWKFYNDHIKEVDGEYYVKCVSLRDIPREDHIKRVRATIQNEENKYLPQNPEVRKQRKISADKWRKYLWYNN